MSFLAAAALAIGCRGAPDATPGSAPAGSGSAGRPAGSGAPGAGPAGPGSKRPPPLVAVVSAEARDVRVEARAPVDLRPIEQIELGSKVLGYLASVHVDRGDRVKRGQTLAVVRPSDLPDQLAAARGTLAQTQAQVALAQANLERAGKLAPGGLVSQQELDAAQAAVRSTEAARAAVQGQIGALSVRIGETRIVAPIDGVVAVRRLDPGALVGPGATGNVLTLVRDDVLRVFVAVGERDARSLAVGQEALVELDALPGERVAGKVARLSPSFDPITRTLDAEVHLDNASHALRPGMYGRAAIVLDVHRGATVVPSGAVQFSDGKAFTFVLKGEVVERREVTVGQDDGVTAEIGRGVSPGDEVVVAGADGLSSGAKVRVSRGVDPYSGARKNGHGG